MNQACRFHKYMLLLLTIILMFGVLLMQCSCDVSEPHSVTAPNTPSGLQTGVIGESLEYATGGSTCSQNHDVEYRFDWGDEDLSDWGAEVQAHSYENPGVYIVRAQARCAKKTGIESIWSAGKRVTIMIETGTMTGNDGTVYQTVKIGNQWWMAENLKETQYRNGEAILNATADSTWAGLSTGARCAYENNETTANTYGYLYNWYAVDDNRKLAPSGWRVPTDADWKQLEMYLGMNQEQADKDHWRGTDEGGQLKEAGTGHWRSPNTGATNERQFAALPGGYRYGGGQFANLGNRASFWSATEYDASYAWGRELHYYESGVFRQYYNNRYGFSVRLIRDN
jgi:uncharacterized protein (TIGR02145 family)